MKYCFVLMLVLSSVSAHAGSLFKSEDFVSFPGIEGGRQFQISEVTFTQWHAINPYLPQENQMPWEDPACKLKFYPGNVGPNFPVICVSQSDVDAFIRVLNSSDPDYYYRLPTGDELDFIYERTLESLGYYDVHHEFHVPEERLTKVAWYSENSGRHAHEVCTKEPVFGLCDILGNVWERANQTYSPNGMMSMPRGYSWFINGQALRTIFFKTSDYGRNVDVGFRLVRLPRR